MRLHDVAVLGGGPGGLYVAKLLKQRFPDCRVRLHEQTEPEQTFGFGVGLASRTQRNLQAADPETFDDILRHSYAHVMAMSVDGRTVALPSDNIISIGRTTLLDVLRRHARQAGVELEYGQRVAIGDLDAQLVVAADGVGSATRQDQAAEFGARTETHDALYLWAGAGVALPTALFAPATTEHGTFVAHAYPYAEDRSTFLIETDADTWRRSGFDVTTEQTPIDDDDQRSLDYLTEAFARHLQGNRLLGNRTRWLRFRTVMCERWHCQVAGRAVVLLGDAAHTAHYSIGSGTKLAMEDGIALVDTLASTTDLSDALAAYERIRRPAVEHLQQTALRSMRWWDSFPTRLDLPVERLWVSYMTRGGKVSLERFARSAPDVVRVALAQYAARAVDEVPSYLTSYVLNQPLERGSFEFSSRLVAAPELVDLPEVRVSLDNPWGAAADDLVKDVAHGSAGQSGGVLLTCHDSVEAVLTMFDVAERLRREAGVLTVASVQPVHVPLAAAALVSGRIDLVAQHSDSVAR